MSAVYVSEQDLSFINTLGYCIAASFALIAYNWILCLDQEIRFIWNWDSRRATVSTLVYALSRYTSAIEFLLGIMTIYPMSDLSCRANTWGQIISQILNQIGLSTFSALRAYALSNRNIWLAAVIICLALPPTTMRILVQFYQAPENLPSPWNCSSSSTLSPALFTSVFIVTRGSQLIAELLVVGITWWYTYQSYRIHKGINLGKTVSSLLLYNGSMYFLFLAALFILDIVFGTPGLVPLKDRDFGSYLDTLIDPITSILTCHFMLSLRQFDSKVADTTYSELGPQLQEHMAGSVLQFAAQPSDSLPAAIASFAHPVHVDESLFPVHVDESLFPMVPSGIVEDEFELPEVAGGASPTLVTTSSPSPTRSANQAPEASV